MSERDFAVRLANVVLDRVNADPDDDLAVLARQLGRAHEREAHLHVVVGRLSQGLITVANVGSGEAKRVALQALRLCEIEP